MGGWRLAATPLVSALCFAALRPALGQKTPIAIVPTDGVELAGALDVAQGKATITSSGSVTAIGHPATITLPHRGNLRICSTTTVSLTSDSSVDESQADSRGLMMALGRGALEANFATVRNSDVILTPDFRIIISAPGVAQVQVRLGAEGDTCVDNKGANAPYVTVSSVFDGGVYRVQAGQRVMFLHGSLREVVDNEKESCGCPPEPVKSLTGDSLAANEFPVAQSEGLAPLSPAPAHTAEPGVQAAQVTARLGYDGSQSAAAQGAAAIPAAPATAAATAPPAAETAPASTEATAPRRAKSNAFTKVAHFFRRLFGG